LAGEDVRRESVNRKARSLNLPVKRHYISEDSSNRAERIERDAEVRTHAMDEEKIIAEIELLEHILTLPDKRPLRMADWKAANQKHDQEYANNPWFRLWKRDEG
jgi:hypothetical protein